MKFTKPALIAVAVLAIVGALAYALMDKPGAPAATFTTLEGKSIALDELRGKVVLVNFWATSCPAASRKCRAWSKPTSSTRPRLRNHRGGDALRSAQLRGQFRADAAAAVSGGARCRRCARARFRQRAVTPTSFIIGKDGRILEQKLGELDFVRLKALLDRELS